MPSDSTSTFVGILGILVSIISWGTYGAIFKFPKLEKLNMHPLAVQTFVCAGVSSSGLLLLFKYDFSFTWWGILGGFIWTPAVAFVQIAVLSLGIAASQGLWSGAIIIVSFVCGVILDSRGGQSLVVGSWFLTCVAFLLLFLGIAGISTLPVEKKTQYTPLDDKLDGSDNDDTKLLLSPGVVEVSSDIDHHIQENGKYSRERQKYLMGLFAVLVVGITCGVVMVPHRLAGEEFSGIIYVLSFYIGIAVCQICFLVGYYAFRHLVIVKRWSSPKIVGVLGIAWPPSALDFKSREAGPICFAAGFVWSCGNFGSFFADMSPLGMTVGYPLTQLALVVGGLWGILVFKELVGKQAITRYCVFTGVLLLGATLLVLEGPKKST